MKKIIPVSLVAVFCTMLFLASCTKEDNTQNAPTNADPRASFVGNWHVSENSKDYGTSTYNVTNTDSSDASHILIAYLYGFNKKTYATISGSTLSIPQQIIQGNKISGSGTLVNDTHLNLSYLVQTTTTHYDTVSATLVKF